MNPTDKDSDGRFFALVEGYLDGKLSARELEELEAAVVGDPGRRAEFIGQVRTAHGLGAFIRRRSDERFWSDVQALIGDAATARKNALADAVDATLDRAPRHPRRTRRRWVSAAAAGAALAAAVALIVWRSTPPTGSAPMANLGGQPTPARRSGPEVPGAPPPAATSPAPDRAQRLARVDRVVGRVQLVGDPARVIGTGESLTAANGVVTVGPASAARVSYPDGTRLDLGGDTTVVQLADGSGKRLFLAAGHLEADVMPQKVPLVFTTPHAQATVVGTRLLLAVDAGGTRLDVSDGEVRIASLAGGRPVNVHKGRYAIVQASGEISAPFGTRPALFLTDSEGPPGPGDQAVHARLERLGFQVRTSSPSAEKPFDPAEARLVQIVVVSSTVASRLVGDRLRDLPVPVVVWEPNLFPLSGMTGTEAGQDYGETADRQYVKVNAIDHALAAGLADRIKVTRTADTYSWGRPSLYASWVATAEDDPTRAAIFGYERGAIMVGLAAPARRVGLFLGNNTAATFTAAGWTIFDNAIRWAAGDVP